jgi:hypothetical protein
MSTLGDVLSLGSETGPGGTGHGRLRDLTLVVGTAAVLLAGVVVAAVRSSDGDASSVNTSAWIRVVDRHVGFTDQLPAKPANQAVPPVTVGGGSGTFRLALIRQPGADAASRPLIIIERGDVVPAVPAVDFARTVRAAIFGFAGGSGFNLKSNKQSTFQGHTAWLGTFEASDGITHQAIAFMETGSRIYVITAPSNYFGPVLSDFRPITPTGG